MPTFGLVLQTVPWDVTADDMERCVSVACAPDGVGCVWSSVLYGMSVLYEWLTECWREDVCT